MPVFLKIIQVVLLSTVKFLFAPPLSIGYGFNYWETIIMTSSGGILGIFIFYYLSNAILKVWQRTRLQMRRAFGMKEKLPADATQKRSFTRRNKLLVRLRGRFGMLGVIILTPCIISIPIGCFLAYKYYSGHRMILPYLCLSVVCWSFALSTLYFLHMI